MVYLEPIFRILITIVYIYASSVGHVLHPSPVRSHASLEVEDQGSDQKGAHPVLDPFPAHALPPEGGEPPCLPVMEPAWACGLSSSFCLQATCQIAQARFLKGLGRLWLY